MVALPLRLKKDADQLGLFGGAEPVKLTPKAKRRKKLQAKQMNLFGEAEEVKPKGKSGMKGRRARKGGEFIAGKQYKGGQWIPKAAFEAQAAGQTYQGKQKKPQPQGQGLALVQDEPKKDEPQHIEKPKVEQLKPKTQKEKVDEADPTPVANELKPKGEPEELTAVSDEQPNDESDRTAPAEEGPKEGDRTSREVETPVTTPETESPSLDVNADYASTKQQQQRLKINQQVRDLLAEKPDGPYSKDELVLLARYSGKGGITDDEGSLSEYYTRPDVAKFTKDLLSQFGFQGGTVLEPSCGNGVFLQQFKADSNVLPVGVELDETSGAAAAALNPHAEVSGGQSFERFLLNNPDFSPDAIIGNVPFGTRTVEDLEAFRKVGKGWKDNGDFFVHESMSRMKPGGVMALIVPHGVTTGSNHQKLRRELTKQGRMVGAYRLPNTAFEHSGTKTVTDILVMQKHPDSVLNAIAQGDRATIEATRDDSFIQGKYFDENPQHILGRRRETTNQFGGTSFTVDGDIEQGLKQAQPLQPKVTYDGLEKPQEETPNAGDTRYINGRLYRLEGQPLRWHLVDESEETPAEEGLDPSAFGVESMAEAEAKLSDPGERVAIHPDQLGAYISIADNHLHGADVAYLKDAAQAVGDAGSTIEKEKVSHAMVLAGHIKLVQQNGADDIELQQTLGMLQTYREKYGNPALDKDLSALSDRFPQLLQLQGAFDETGKISDYFANHDAVAKQALRSHSEAGAAMAEAFRAAGGEMVDLESIKMHLDSDMADQDIEAALSSDPTVGYMGGGYMPIDRLLVGNGFNLMDAMMMESEGLPEGSPLRRKLEEQISTIRTRLEPRALEDMTTPFWAVGSWIPAEALNEFMVSAGYDDFEAEYDAERGEWRTKGRFLYGTAEDVLTTMNRGRISHGQNTKEAKEAVAALEQDFKNWLAGSEYRLQVEEAYNVAFNGDLPQEFSGDKLDIALFDQHDGDPEKGIRKKRLHDYQTSTIRQMEQQGRGIIALGVGLGKTATSIGLALRLKEVGRAKKPTFVVPKSVLANWVREVDFWAPDANVMILGQTQKFWKDGSPMWEVPGYKVTTKGGLPKQDKDGNFVLENKETGDAIAMSPEQVKKRSNLVFSDDNRATKERKMQQLAQNSYDIVLMSEPVFQDIALHPDKEGEYLDDLAQTGSHLNPDAKQTHKDKERLEAARRRLAERSGEKTDNITFEDLGIDCLFHDEAHHTKNLFGTQRTGDVAFLSQAQSNRALDFYYKSRYIREMNNNQNTYLLTATPTTNNPLEAFNMLQHVAPEEFEKRGIQNVDDFLSMFGKIESVTVPGVNLEMTEKNGLIGFKNLKDLRKLFNKYCRMQSAKDVGLPIPEEQTQDHMVEMTAAQKEVYDDLKLRAEKVSSGDDTDDHIFSVISDMDKAAIDLGYYNATSSGLTAAADIPEGEVSPKIGACAQNVMSSLNANGGKQIVFCDAVQLHQSLKDQLVAAGYPADQIQIVNAQTAKRSSDRQKISQAYNDGRISLVIGNTATMGEGMNFQIGTTDIHHLTTPWTPAAIEQRNGRGVRQGNELDGVGCHYYHAKGSFDAYRKGVIERKRGWIDDLWKGTEDEADNQNTGALSMDEISVMMADNPEAARQQMEANRELQMQRHREKMTKAAMKQFGQVQTMGLALSKMSPENRGSARGRALEARYRAAKEALGRNEYFPHKDLLDGGNQAYVGTDGTVLKVGDHVSESDGSVYRVAHVDPSTQKLTTQMVSGPDYNPNRISKEPQTFSFKMVNAKRGIKPTAFDTKAHNERAIGALRSFDDVAMMAPEAINENRDRILNKLKEDSSHRSIPFVHPESGNIEMKTPLRDMPDNAQVLWPHDGHAVETVLKEMAQDKQPEWRYQGLLETLTNQSWYGLRHEMRQRVQTYRDQFAAMKEQGPKEGDRKTEGGVEYELKGSRWHRVGSDEPATEPQQSNAPKINQALIDKEVDGIPELSAPPLFRRMVRQLSSLLMDDDFPATQDEVRETIIDIMNKGQRLGHMRPLSADKKEAIASKLISKLMPQTEASASTAAPPSEIKDLGGGKTFDTAGTPQSGLEAVKQGILANPAIASSLAGGDKQNAELAVKAEFDKQMGAIARSHTSFYKDVMDSPRQRERLKQQLFDELWESGQEAANIMATSPTGVQTTQPTPAAEPVNPRVMEENPGPHPDPLGAIKDALVRIEMDDAPDRGRERNDAGWNAFTREFGQSLAQQVQSGGDLTPNQYKRAWEMLTTKHRPQAGRQASLEELEEALQAMPAPAVDASLKQTVHAKKGIDLHVVALNERVPRETYDRLNAQAKRLGGYYSRYNKRGAIPGFQFEDRDSAEKMMDYVYTLSKSAGPTYTIMGVPYAMTVVGSAVRLVKSAATSKLSARLVSYAI